MANFRFIILASALVTAGFAGADVVAAGRAPDAKTIGDRLPVAAQGAPVAVSRPITPMARPASEEPAAVRTCPARSWPYGTARCFASAPGVRVIALDAVAPNQGGKAL